MSQETKWEEVAHYYLLSNIGAEKRGVLEMLGLEKEVRKPIARFEIQDFESWQKYNQGWDKYLPVLRHVDDMSDQRRLKVLEDHDWWAFARDYEQGRLVARNDPRWNGKLVQWEVFRHGKWLLGQVSLTNDHIHNLIKYIKEGYDVFGLIESGQAVRKGKEL